MIAPLGGATTCEHFRLAYSEFRSRSFPQQPAAYAAPRSRRKARGANGWAISVQWGPHT